MIKRVGIGIGLAALAAVQLGAQEGRQQITMPFRDPSMPRKLIVEGGTGSLTIRGYQGQDALIEYTGREIPGANNRRGGRNDPPDGMHRIGGSRGLDITEENNTVRVNSQGIFGGTARDMVIQVPAQTSVNVKTMFGGIMTIENISGDIEAENFNGQVTINNASGSVVAHSMNGKILVSLDRVAADKSMSFSTFNGDVDVTLPADTKARFKMRTDFGDIFTDFDVKMEANAAPVVEEEKDRKGKSRRRVRVDGTQSGTINGGGPEMQFTTFNGRILIHKK
ncbi:MAG: DUF4097 domain-containing protein [Acidobacteriia bacterium]|nr:DUF4097 domain-containing protein [Terriglobia bacterium]